MSSLAATALSGMSASWLAMDAAAGNIANAETPGYKRAQVAPATTADGGVSAQITRADTPGEDIATDMVGMLSARNGFLANLAVFRAGNQAMGSLLDATA